MVHPVQKRVVDLLHLINELQNSEKISKNITPEKKVLVTDFSGNRNASRLKRFYNDVETLRNEVNKIGVRDGAGVIESIIDEANSVPADDVAKAKIGLMRIANLLAKIDLESAENTSSPFSIRSGVHGSEASKKNIKPQATIASRQNQNSSINLPSFSLSAVPSELRHTIAEDLEEIKKCLNAGCYRSVVILCGRVLEVALHRLYFDTTGIDMLEKAPGTGLGNMIAKLAEKNVKLDPGLTQQIHLINNIRIFSVHAKQESFNPSEAQAQGIMLFTVDVLAKIFVKKQ